MPLHALEVTLCAWLCTRRLVFNVIYMHVEDDQVALPLLCKTFHRRADLPSTEILNKQSKRFRNDDH